MGLASSGLGRGWGPPILCVWKGVPACLGWAFVSPSAEVGAWVGTEVGAGLCWWGPPSPSTLPHSGQACELGCRASLHSVLHPEMPLLGCELPREPLLLHCWGSVGHAMGSCQGPQASRFMAGKLFCISGGPSLSEPWSGQVGAHCLLVA